MQFTYSILVFSNLKLSTTSFCLALPIFTGSLKLEQLQCVVLDWSWRDGKQKTIVDIPPIKKDLFALMKDNLIPCVKRQKNTRIGLF